MSSSSLFFQLVQTWKSFWFEPVSDIYFTYQIDAKRTNILEVTMKAGVVKKEGVIISFLL